MTDRAGTIRLWDLPVRLVHWSFVALVPLLWWSGEEGDLDLHRTLGCLMLALVLFRLLWGFAGSATARFSSFVTGPAGLAAYLRGQRPAGPGHNPLGALSVVALLAVLGAQVGFGLFAQDVDGIESGPLAYLVSYEAADRARDLHHLGFSLLLGLIGLHLAAIVYYRLIRRDNLVTPMITGRRAVDPAVAQPRLAPLWLAGLLAALAGAVAWWVAAGAPLPGSGG